MFWCPLCLLRVLKVPNRKLPLRPLFVALYDVRAREDIIQPLTLFRLRVLTTSRALTEGEALSVPRSNIYLINKLPLLGFLLERNFEKIYYTVVVNKLIKHLGEIEFICLLDGNIFI